jgi:hypothetical protein
VQRFGGLAPFQSKFITVRFLWIGNIFGSVFCRRCGSGSHVHGWIILFLGVGRMKRRQALIHGGLMLRSNLSPANNQKLKLKMMMEKI